MSRSRTTESTSTFAPGAIVAAPVPEEREYEQRLATIATRRRELAQQEAEVAGLKAALARFTATCEARIGDLLAELRRVNRAITEYERRMQRLDEHPRPDEIPPDLDLDDEPNLFGWDDEPESADAASAPPPGATRPPSRPRLDRQNEAETKRLYRDLAKRCHPDQTPVPAERERRVELMQRINEAFRDRDMAALRELDRQSRAEDATFSRRPVTERLAWASGELHRLDSHLAEAARELTWMRGTEAHRLWSRSEAGEDVFTELEDVLEARLAVESRRLDRLVGNYRRRIDMREPVSAAGP